MRIRRKFVGGILQAKDSKEFDMGITLGEMLIFLTIKELAEYIKETEKNIYSSILCRWKKKNCIHCLAQRGNLY